MFKIYDGRDKFYQWDLDRQLIIEDPSITQVHFTNRATNDAYVCETYVEDGKTLVNVPNILLQANWRIQAYAYDGKHTKHDVCYEVVSRSKPNDYVYTETEILDYKDLEEKINANTEALANIDEVIAEVTQDSVNYYGEVEEELLPTNGKKGDMYKIFNTTIEPVYKYFSSGELVYQAWGDDWDGDGVLDDILSDGTGFYDSVGAALLTNEELPEYTWNYESYPINIYDEDKQFLFNTSMFFAGEISLWVVGNTSNLTLGNTYYIERADEKIPSIAQPEQVGEKTVIVKDKYALHNGSNFDYLYNIDGVKNVASKKQDIDKWELIDIFELDSSAWNIELTEEPNGKPYDFKKLRISISELGGSGTAYVYNNGNYDSNAYFKFNDNDVLIENYVEGGHLWLKVYAGFDRNTPTNFYCGSLLAGNNIHKIYISGNLPAYTKIKIWGVRN